MDKFICLITAGAIGTLARYGIASAIYLRMGRDFPYGTLLVNLIGCFLAGFFDAFLNEKFALSPTLRLFLLTGFCGAFTTFSALILDSSNLARDGEFFKALLNVVISCVIGFIIFRLGGMLGKII